MPDQGFMESERTITRRGRTLRFCSVPAIRAALDDFSGNWEDETLEIFDAILDHGGAVVDIGAHIGLTTLFSAARAPSVHSFEPNPASFEILSRNVALNPDLARKITLHPFALGDKEAMVPFFSKGLADSGSGVFRYVQRSRVIDSQRTGEVRMANAVPVLKSLPLEKNTLVKIDTEGSEYILVPHIREIIESRKPTLHLSFHPFNLVFSQDEYVNSLARLKFSTVIAETTLAYERIYIHDGTAWRMVDRQDRMSFLKHALLSFHHLPNIATPQLGLTGAMVFTDLVLDL